MICIFFNFYFCVCQYTRFNFFAWFCCYFSVGKIKLEANWAALGSQPVKIFISDVFVLAGPNVTSVDENAELRFAIENKLSQLQTAEASMLEREKLVASGKSEESDSFAVRFQTFTPLLCDFVVTVLESPPSQNC